MDEFSDKAMDDELRLIIETVVPFGKVVDWQNKKHV